MATKTQAHAVITTNTQAHAVIHAMTEINRHECHFVDTSICIIDSSNVHILPYLLHVAFNYQARISDTPNG